MTMTSEQYNRLPKYARSEIDRLQANYDMVKAKLESMDSGESNVYFRGHNFDMVALPPNTKIEFHLDGVAAKNSHQWGDKVSCYIEDGKLVVMGGIGLSMSPKSGNVVEIETNR